MDPDLVRWYTAHPGPPAVVQAALNAIVEAYVQLGKDQRLGVLNERDAGQYRASTGELLARASEMYATPPDLVLDSDGNVKPPPADWIPPGFRVNIGLSRKVTWPRREVRRTGGKECANTHARFPFHVVVDPDLLHAAVVAFVSARCSGWMLAGYAIPDRALDVAVPDFNP